MKFNKPVSFTLLISLILFACSDTNDTTSDTKDTSSETAYTYTPDDQELHDTIVHLDSIFFDTYNTCATNLEKHASFYSDSLEFYHDKGGLSTSKQETVDAIRRNVCGKVTRELVKGSIEVYPINNYGAVEIGLHRFHNNTEKRDKPVEPSKFIIIWRNQNDAWKITRVISLH